VPTELFTPRNLTEERQISGLPSSTSRSNYSVAMQSDRTERVKAGKFTRRPRSRGVPAPADESQHSLFARIQLLWETMYPLPRLLLTVAFFVACGYGIVAICIVLPSSAAGIFVYALPGLFMLALLALLLRGEPSDQVVVHEPESADAETDESEWDSDSPAPKRLSDKDFEALEDQVDNLAAVTPDEDADYPPAATPSRSDAADDADEFMKLVRQAIDELPPEFAQALDHVAVTVSDQGSVQRLNGRLRPLYGLYVGYADKSTFLGAPRPDQPDRIVIFKDTLSRDYGHDPDRLREQVTRTLRHELAHHLGYDEPGVEALGL
jgi:predicted Zn-dependent protease with MMP-like domain